MFGVNLGSGAISAAKLGSSDVNKIYSGSTEVYPNQLSIPLTGDVIIACMGQSNMVGRSTYTAGATFPSGVQQYNQAGSFEDVTGDTMLDYTEGAAGALTLCVDFAVAFVAANPDANLIFVPYAKGGTGFFNDDWNQGDTLYEAAKDRINAALAAKPSATFGGFLWNQGENDAKTAGGPAVYEANIDAFIPAIRSDVTRATAYSPFVLASFSQAFINDDPTPHGTVNDILVDTDNRHDYVATTEANDLTLFDGLHYDQASTRTLGARYYTNWVRAIQNLGGTAS